MKDRFYERIVQIEYEKHIEKKGRAEKIIKQLFAK